VSNGASTTPSGISLWLSDQHEDLMREDIDIVVRVRVMKRQGLVAAPSSFRPTLNPRHYRSVPSSTKTVGARCGRGRMWTSFGKCPSRKRVS
jgi:hypothetical protein